MQSIDLLISDIGWLITVDPGRRVIRDAAIAVDAGKIVAVGKSAELAAQYSGRRTIDGRNTVATPGYVDCHLHSSFQLSRGLADEANAQSFLFDRMYPYEAALDAEDVQLSATLAAAELLKHGVTCFVDPGNYHPEASVEGVMSTGIRCLVSRSSFDLTKSVLGILPERMIETTAQALERAEAVLEKYAKTGNPRLGASASFRGLNNASDELIVGLHKLARRYGTLLQTHACFSYSTHDSSVARTGMAEIERLESLGVIDETHADRAFRLARARGGRDPGAGASRRWSARRRRACTTATATSCSASCRNCWRSASMSRWARTMRRPASSTCRRRSGSPAAATRRRASTRASCRRRPALEMATINGAKAALMGDKLGSIAVGKEADIVLFDTQRPEWQPLINPVANLVYSATGDSVRDVFVAGEQVVAGGKLTKVDESKLYDEIPVAVARFSRHLKIDQMVQLRWPVS